MKKQYIVLISGVLLVLLFVLGVQVYKDQQNKKYSFLAASNAALFVREPSCRRVRAGITRSRGGSRRRQRPTGALRPGR